MLPIWKFFLDKRQFAILVMFGLLIAGTVAVRTITKESAPEVQIPIGIVSIALPGAGPEEVERLVTNKIEAQLANIGDLNKLTSTSRDGFSVVVVEFRASANLEKSIQKLKDEVDKLYHNIDVWKKPFLTTLEKLEQPPRGVLYFDYGYAITCHKSQGSEWDHVLVYDEVLFKTDMKRWRYTAITRAAKKLTYCI